MPKVAQALTDAQSTTRLKALPRFENNPLIFPAQRGGQLSDMTLSATIKCINATDKQGFVDRVSKRAAERTHFDPAMAELALAHKIGNAVKAAYRRGDMVERRCVMMDGCLVKPSTCIESADKAVKGRKPNQFIKGPIRRSHHSII